MCCAVFSVRVLSWAVEFRNMVSWGEVRGWGRATSSLSSYNGAFTPQPTHKHTHIQLHIDGQLAIICTPNQQPFHVFVSQTLLCFETCFAIINHFTF
jgi:hypothetical protein